MKLMEFTAYGVPDEVAPITINLDNVNAIYASEKKDNKGNTTIYYSNGNWTYLRETYTEVMEAIRKAYG
jgi:hypothetical protein